MLVGVCFVVLAAINMVWPGLPLEWVGGTRCTKPLDKTILRIASVWMLIEGLYIMGVPILTWFSPLRYLLFNL